MSILDHVIEKDTGYLHPRKFTRSALMNYKIEDGGVIMNATDFAHQYKLSAEFGVTFSANKANFDRNHQMARKLLLSRVHEGLLGLMVEMEHAILNEDLEIAYEICGRIRSELGL